ncbi:alpha/beta fold hydrolase [Tunicatimonas pelagia]|uniref:alpha/beta fold hydrolase n=1 Tax=Tunicatimonas pelagia TaxID=931531 RepID=UPI00266682F2|nr:alpha/beta hydrolase [Tunicatimonas pelagia]WKN43759.1 alpha/beta hydrolase [Tunicatimonas pelagia]
MKLIVSLIIGLLIGNSVLSKPPIMKEKYIKTSIGEIAVQIKKVPGTTSIIFLHGVYYDHHLWNYQTARISDRTVVTVDMPLHGSSKHITKKEWTLNDCSTMLIEILDSLKIARVIAIGHSWGSMTILRAASQHPNRFQSIGLGNMPFEAANKQVKRQFRMRHLLLSLRGFYTQQVAKTLYGKHTLKQNPDLREHLDLSMSKLTNQEVKQTDKSVIVNADNAEPLLEQVEGFAFALKGKEDYVPTPKNLKTTVVKGGHISPLEAPEEVFEFVMKVVNALSVTVFIW